MVAKLLTSPIVIMGSYLIKQRVALDCPGHELSEIVGSAVLHSSLIAGHALEDDESPESIVGAAVEVCFNNG